jgi:putative Mn2+ efflux pump MntP
VFELLGFVLPLGFETFAVAFAVLGTGLSTAQRLRVTVLFMAFEAGMPLVGLALGAPLARLIGNAARYVAPLAIAAIGVYILREGTDDDDGGDDADGEAEVRKARALIDARGFAIIGLGIGISLDELAVGFSLGFTKLPITAVIVAIAIQSFIAIQAGAYLASRIADRPRGSGHRRLTWGERVIRYWVQELTGSRSSVVRHQRRAKRHEGFTYILHEWTGAGRRHRHGGDERIRDRPERLAGITLIALAAFLFVEPFITHE